MVDWMLEVLKTFDCSDETYFLSVALLDRYLGESAKRGRIVTDDDVHLLGVACMLIASKFEDTTALTLDLVIAKVGHYSFTKK